MKGSEYSGTPLAKKLGIKIGFIIRIANPPSHYKTLFSDFPIFRKRDGIIGPVG